MEVAHSSPTKKTASSRWSSRDQRAAGPSEEYKDDYVNDLEPYELNEELDELHLEEGQQQSGAIEVIDLSDDDSDDDDEVIALDE